jgi:hypothetical protein
MVNRVQRAETQQDRRAEQRLAALEEAMQELQTSSAT